MLNCQASVLGDRSGFLVLANASLVITLDITVKTDWRQDLYCTYLAHHELESVRLVLVPQQVW